LFAVDTVPAFKKMIDEDFEYLVTVTYKDLTISIEGGDFEVECVFGSPGHEYPKPGVLLEVSLSSPSAKENPVLTKGGIIVAKLRKIRNEGGEIKLGITYFDKNGKKISDEKKLNFPFPLHQEGKDIWSGKTIVRLYC